MTGGNGVSATSSGSGGGILVQSGAQLNVSGAAIEANTGASGGGINVAGALLMDTSTVSGNSVEGRLTAGGGITTTGTTAIINSTISGNTAAGSTSQGGGIASNGFLGLNGVTISNNTASAAAGLLESIPAASAPNRTILNTIIGGNNGPECAGSGLDTDTTRNSLADDTTCALADATDQQGVNPQLRALANYGGATDTHALLSASPAINKGSGCVPAAGPIDQRGVSRPQAGTACDVGAFEYRPHALTVITNVVNNNGGTLTAAQAQVHVRVDGADAKGSPAAGVSGGGRAYSLLTGNAYVVAADAVTGYGLSYSAGCSAVLAEGGATTCTVTVDDIAPTLKVVTVVQNDSGGNAVAADFSAHVRQGGRDVSGSPQAGSGTGTTYTLSSGNFSVSAEGVPGYSATGSGGCAADGSVTLALGDNKTCTITADDGASQLRVITQVVNDNGGTKAPSDFLAHVRNGLGDVTGSPQLGTLTGTLYSLVAGQYAVAVDAVPGYTLSVAGDCAANGSVTLVVGQPKSCTFVANDVAPTLTVFMGVTNDNGGALGPANFSVHVRSGSADVSGSPQPGSASGTTYTLAAGSYDAAADAVAGYTLSGCSVTLAVGDAKSCTVTANDNAVSAFSLPPPVIHKSVNLLPSSGKVLVKTPGGKNFVLSVDGQQVPLGTIVDVRKGRVTLIAAADSQGGTAQAVFYGGIFKLGQTKAKTPVTVLSLVEKLTGCKAKGKASIAKKKVKKRRLWGDGKGRFQTKGKHSAATVVGTKWMVEDRCTSTLTKVARGRVKVADFGKHKTVFVKAGRSTWRALVDLSSRVAKRLTRSRVCSTIKLLRGTCGQAGGLGASRFAVRDACRARQRQGEGTS